MTSLRRRTLLKLAGASSAAVAGCQGLNLDAGQGNVAGDQQASGREVTTREAIETGLLNGVPQVRAQADEGLGDARGPLPGTGGPVRRLPRHRRVRQRLVRDRRRRDRPRLRLQRHVDVPPGRGRPDDDAAPRRGRTVDADRSAGRRGGQLRRRPQHDRLRRRRGRPGGDANIVETDGNVIDYTFENVIFRWGGGDALHPGGQCQRLSRQNAWVENVNGHALYLGGGNRLKVDNVHAIGSGFKIEGAESHFTNVTIFSAGGADGIVNTTPGNQYADVILKGGPERRLPGTSRFAISNMHVEGAKQSAIVDGTGNSPISNVFARNWGERTTGGPAAAGQRVVGPCQRRVGRPDEQKRTPRPCSASKTTTVT